jgi:hypothetical protein
MADENVTVAANETAVKTVKTVAAKKATKKVAKKEMTARQFAASLGLKRTGLDYLGTTVLLKVLVRRGIAQKVGKVHTKAKRGRKSVIYSIPTQFVLTSKTA